MKKFIICFALCLMATLNINAQEKEHLKFMGIPIEGNASAFSQKLVTKGFVKTKTSENTCALKGTFAGEKDVELIVCQTPKTKQVWKVSVYLPKVSTWSIIKRQYERYKTSFSEKYGTPDHNYEFFDSPYYEGDGYEESAVKNEKCFYASIWDCGLMVSISQFMQIKLVYEDPINSELDDKEKNQVIEDDI